MSELARAAMWYATRLEWQVFPCGERAKVPAIQNGVRQASRNPRQVEAWWRARPELNVAVACGPDSGVYVLDVDKGDGKDGELALAELERKLGALPETVEQITGGGGRQLLFLYPDGVTLKNSVGSRAGLGAGLDTRSEGGYVVLPPSIHPSGTPYRWRPDYGPHQRAFAELPEAWIRKLEYRPPLRTPPQPVRAPGALRDKADETLQRQVDRLYSAMPGTRNDTLYRAAFYLAKLSAAGELYWQDAESALYSAGRAIGLEEKETVNTIRSAKTGFDRS